MALALLQGLPPADTVVVVAARDGYDVVLAAAAASVLILMAVCAAGVVAILVLLRNAQRGVRELAERVAADPGVESLRKVAADLSSISGTVREEVDHLAGSVGSLSDRLGHLSRRLEERIEELNALIEVVQEEAEGAFVKSAARARGFRAGFEALRRRRRGKEPDATGDESEPDSDEGA